MVSSNNISNGHVCWISNFVLLLEPEEPKELTSRHFIVSLAVQWSDSVIRGGGGLGGKCRSGRGLVLHAIIADSLNTFTKCHVLEDITAGLLICDISLFTHTEQLIPSTKLMKGLVN